MMRMLSLSALAAATALCGATIAITSATAQTPRACSAAASKPTRWRTRNMSACRARRRRPQPPDGKSACGVETYSVAEQKYVGVPCTAPVPQDRGRQDGALRRRDLFGGGAEIRRRALHAPVAARSLRRSQGSGAASDRGARTFSACRRPENLAALARAAHDVPGLGPVLRPRRHQRVRRAPRAERCGMSHQGANAPTMNRISGALSHRIAEYIAVL